MSVHICEFCRKYDGTHTPSCPTHLQKALYDLHGVQAGSAEMSTVTGETVVVQPQTEQPMSEACRNAQELEEQPALFTMTVGSNARARAEVDRGTEGVERERYNEMADKYGAGHAHHMPIEQQEQKRPGVYGTGSDGVVRNSTANKPAKTVDDGNVVIQLVCKMDKKEREGYQFPNFTAIDCLRQDLKMYEDNQISLLDFISMLQTTHLVDTIVQVSR